MKDLRADKTLLQEKYNKIKDMTQGNATDASWNDFTRLRELANAILTDPKRNACGSIRYTESIKYI